MKQKKDIKLMTPPKKYMMEAYLKKAVREFLKSKNAKFFMPVPVGFSEGAVDFLVCYKGKFIAIETKVKTNKPTALQMDWLVSTVKAGGSAVVAYDLSEVENVIRSVDEGKQYACARIIEEMQKRKKQGTLCM